MARDPYEYFRVEAREIVDGINRGILQLEKDGSPEATAGLLRLAHTLKGAARVVRQPGIADDAHAIEEALAPLRDSAAVVTRGLIDRVLSLADAIADAVGALGAPSDAHPAEPKPSARETREGGRADAAELEALLDGVGEASVQLHGLRRSLDAMEQARRLSDLLVSQLAPRPMAQTAAGVGPFPEKVRAVANELRGLLNRADRQLSAAAEQTDRELREVRGAAERLSLVPASTLFTPLERVARDIATSLGKDVTFSARGADVRLEAATLVVIQGALIQAVRNAVAHGVEVGGERVRGGKPRTGRIELEVSRRGGKAVFICRDDGRGVDLDAVRRAADRRGLLPEGGTALSTDDVLRLLLRGGVTTAGGVTQAAGRGVGLDVVRDAAARLGGDVTIETGAGRGTSLSLAVPLSISAVDALLVDSGDVAAAIPLAAVRQTVRLAPGDIRRTSDGEAIVYEGTVIPFVPLTRSLGHRTRNYAVETSRSAVVVAGTGALAAVGVDRLKGVGNVVVRPLPPLTPSTALVAGAALDSDGSPQLVLDPAGLVADALSRATVEPPPEAQPPPVVLVIDDSLTTRMMERSILESAGYEVDLATSGEEGLEQARKRRYELYLVDVEMPGIDGFTFIKRTRTDPLLRVVPAILVTSRDTPEDRRRGEEAGASGYVVKGEFDQRALLTRIRELVGR